MSILNDLLEEAQNEVMQEEWDKCLLAAFRSTTYLKTWGVVDDFQKTHKLNREAFQKLKRVPRYTRHFNTRIPRFIAAYLPALSDKLYDSKMSDDALIAWMRNLDTEKNPSDLYKSNADFRMRQKSARETAVNKIEWMATKDSHLKHSGHAWSTVKTVRSKS